MLSCTANTPSTFVLTCFLVLLVHALYRMRNVINLDRGDDGYSPLWNVFWMTELPMNYKADEISNAVDVKTDTGFALFVAPMFINCPDIGKVATSANVLRQDLTGMIDASQNSTMVLGSDPSLIFQKGVPISFITDGVQIANTQTNFAGAYQLELESCKIPAGTTEIEVMANNAQIRTIAVINDAENSCHVDPVSSPNSSPTDSSSTEAQFSHLLMVVGFAFGTLVHL